MAQDERNPASVPDCKGMVGEGALQLHGPLWEFALDFYAKPGVATALLTLQDEADVDVIQVLLTTYTYKNRGHALSAVELAAAASEVDEWREVVVLPLRSVRKKLRSAESEPDKERLRQDVKKAELLAEQIQIAMVQRWLNGRHTLVGLQLKEGISLLVSQCRRDYINEQCVMAAIDKIVDAASFPSSGEDRDVSSE
jgi:uncharacterized protein (TIGR02444 family)